MDIAVKNLFALSIWNFLIGLKALQGSEELTWPRQQVIGSIKT
jgi:hypothetical protein